MKLPYDLSCQDGEHWSLLTTAQANFILRWRQSKFHCCPRSRSRSSQASAESDFQRCSSSLNSCAAKNADLGTHKVLGGRRSLSCSFLYLKGSKIFLGIRNFVSKMRDRIKFQKHVSFNYIILLKLDVE